jgi:hypothetical protein
MKRLIGAVVLASLLAMSAVGTAFAGMPQAHGVDGRTFGGLVSELAQANPLALASHVSGR